MPLTTYCQPDEVRAALGVNATELSDQVLALPVYEMGLVRELNKLSTSLGASFSLIANKTFAARTDDERNFFDSVSLFAVYTVAAQVGVSLANFAPRAVSDGKASITRFSGEPYELVMKRVETLRARYRGDVVSALVQLISGVAGAPMVAPRLFAAARRGIDPVTGA